MAKVPDKYLQARTAEILIAASECFARQGYRGTSMSDIATESGLSVGGLYRYFESKEALFHGLTQRAGEVNQTLWGKTEDLGKPNTRLRAFVNRYMDMAVDPNCRAGLALDLRLHGEALDSEMVRSEVQKAYLGLLGTITGLLRASKGLDQDDHITRAEGQALISLLNGAGIQILVGADFNIEAYRETTLAAVEMWTAAPKSRPKKAKST